MFLKRIVGQNFRTLSNFDLEFADHYTAICGKNNSGKSNVVRVVRYFLTEDDGYPFEDDWEVEFKRDRTAWDPAAENRPIRLSIEVLLDPLNDRGLVEFIAKFSPDKSSPAEPPELVRMSVSAQIGPEGDKEKFTVSVGETPFDEFSSQEVVKKLRTSVSCVYHNSIGMMYQYRFRPGPRLPLSGSLTTERREKLLEKQRALNNEVDRCIEPHKIELAEMLGRLSEKYEVTLKAPGLSVERVPIGISLGDKLHSVPLDEWGSGTRNRTMILRSLFDARQAAQAKQVSDRLVPIMVIEEPESFLHPSAQAEFGAVIQELAQEFQIQVIVTSHSPYMLSHRNERSNVLLARNVVKRKGQASQGYRETERVVTTGANWKQPFEHALGVSGPEFDFLKQAIFSNSREILLVEGATDREYFEDLLNEAHGDNRLDLRGPIVSYDGAGALANAALVKFLVGLFRVPIITYDLDQDGELSRKLEAVGLIKDQDFFAVGRDVSGCRAIEGLLPSDIIKAVSADNPGVVLGMNSNKSEERRQASNQFKRLCRNRFQADAKPKSDAYADFYKLVRKINKSIVDLRGRVAQP